MNRPVLSRRAGAVRPALAAFSLAALLGVASTAHATDGYFLNGLGAKSKGEGGVGIALPQDALSIAANPAAATELPQRLDVGVEIFAPDRSASIHGNGAGLNGTYSGNGASPFLLPDIGYVRPLGPKLAVGVAFYGNGGMDTLYKANPFAAFGASGAAGVDLKQLFITPTIAFKPVTGHSLGVSPIVVVQSFRASGIQPFAAASEDAPHFTNLGDSWSSGVGVRVGYLGHFGSRVTLGAFYQSKVGASRFKKYAGLFAGQGGFDVPASWGGGVAVKASDALTLALDVKRIDYAGVAAVGDTLSPLFAGVPFGANGGPGFGWRNITVVKVGASYRFDPKLTVRAGYGHADNPVQPSQTLLNILAPGVVQDHFTLGATWQASKRVELTAYVLHAPRKTVAGSGSIPANYAGGEADISLAEHSVGLSAGVTF